jgi:hypothetical protein
MDIYNSVAGALVIGTLLLVGSGVLFVVTRIEQTLRSLRARAATRRVAHSALGIALFVAVCFGLGHLSFERAFDSTHAFVPSNEVRWEPAGELPIPSFDRFDYGSASNAEIARRS